MSDKKPVAAVARDIATILPIETCVFDQAERPNLRVDDHRGCKAREDYLMELSRVLGRTVNTSKELTVSDFRKFMEMTETKAPANSDDPFADLPDIKEAM